MTRFLFWLMVLPLAVLMALFGIKNSQIASLNLDPFPYTLEFPLFALVLGAVLVGVMVGGTSTWLSQGRWRRKARGLNRRVRQLEHEMEDVRTRSTPPALPTSAHERGWRRPGTGSV